MDDETRQVMKACSKGSLEEGLPFPQVVARLAAVGCEQYHADFRRQEKTYYLPDGDSHVDALPLGAQTIGKVFAADTVVAALQAIQAREIDYPEFLRRIIAAGCVGYFVYIAGKRAIYLGRKGEFHVEQFPAAVASMILNYSAR